MIDSIEKEVHIAPNKVIMSKTDYKGLLQYANDYFIEICGYSNEELIGKAHNIIRHPDMPKVIFKTLWNKLHKGKNLYAIVKNKTKDGNYYWVVTKFETTFDKEGNIISHYARRKAVPTKVREIAESIYKTILEIEKHDVNVAEQTFHEILKNYNLTYDDFFLEIAGMSEVEVYDYFQSSEQNINASNENSILAIDTTQKKEVIEITPIKPSNNGFLGDTNELDDALKSFLKKNK
ncbi:MAG: PAS domain-containing protein [Flavobacteriaceae bacterium]